MDDNNTHQTEVGAPEQAGDDPDREPLAEDAVEGHGVESGREEGAYGDSVREEGPGAGTGDTEETPADTRSSDADSGQAGKGRGQEGASLDANTSETDSPKQTSGNREGEGEKEAEREDRNSKEQEAVKKEEIEEGGAEMKEEPTDGGENNTKTEEKGDKTDEGKTDEKRNGEVEKEKVKLGKGPDNKNKALKEKEKGKSKETEKQGKTKRKSGVNPSPSTPSSTPLSRPRTSARSVRASTKNDIIAKFQQGAPETPVARNFKLQRSSVSVANGASIKQKILQWCSNKTRNYEGVSIENFSSSWCDGLAFCALVHRFFPDAFDFSSLKAEERAKNFTLAFNTAETMADCFPLLEVADMILMGDRPDPLCVFTYVQALCHHLSKIEKERKDRKEEEEKKKKNTTGEEEKSEKATGGEESSTEKKQAETGENGGMDGQGREGVDRGSTGDEGHIQGSSGVEGDEEEEQNDEDCGVLVGTQA